MSASFVRSGNHSGVFVNGHMSIAVHNGIPGCHVTDMHRMLSGEIDVCVFDNLQLSRKGDVMMIYQTGRAADVSVSLSYSRNKDAIDSLVAFMVE